MAKKKNFNFKPVPANFDFVENERRLLDWWYRSGLVKKYLTKNNQSKKRFSFMDGPITANNPMGVHHAWGRTLKDLYQRYKNMQGFAQRFQNGFDCQGLWIEVEVEKEKGFKSKKDIEKYGIGKFIKDCKNRALKYAGVQTEQSKRLGYFMDWDNSYYTLSDENNYMIWAFLKKCHSEGSLYKGDDSVPWCPRCGTSISQHEIATEGYRNLTHESAYMKFPVIRDAPIPPSEKSSGHLGGKTSKNEFLLVWTTTPWTIPADTLVAVSPEINYALVEFEGNKYWLAKNLVKDVFGTDLKAEKIVTGDRLIEKEGVNHYQAPFDDLPIMQEVAKKAGDHFHAVVLSKELVNDNEGTGVVHVVPGAGTEDNQLAKQKLGWLDVIFPVIDESANYLEGYGFLTGKNAKDHPELVLNYLKEKDNGKYLLKTKPYTHSYPVCWRCDTELVWRLVDEWYIGMDIPRKTDGKTLRQRMIRVAKKIKWVPGFGLKRELDWLNNMHDWLISKKRYWGLALPVWECQCGHFEVIGSKEELKEKAVEGWQEFDPPAGGHSPHRPEIDGIKIKCPQCGKLVSRIPDVGNPWLDAGIVNFSTLVDPETGQLSYLTDKKYFNQWYPADFVTECFPGQFRNWFYALIAMSTALEDQAPFKTLLGHALVKDEKGEEMHKSKGNAIWFDDAAEKMGVDTMRWLYLRQNPELTLNFGYKIADEVRRQFIFLYWNSYRFFVTYASLNGFQPTQTLNLKPKTLLDTTNTPGVGLDSPGASSLDKWIISRLESTKTAVKKKLDRYHHQEAIKEIEEFLNDLSTWYVRRSRDRVNPNNRNSNDRNACLATLYYVLRNLSLILAPFIPYLAETIWQGLHGKSEDRQPKDSVHLENWPKINSGLINKNLEKQMALARGVVALGHSLRKEKQLKVRQPLSKFSIFNFRFTKFSQQLIELIKEELNVKEVIFKDDKGALKVELDSKLTPELKQEGDARELIRQIQILRREAKLSLEDRIVVYAPSWPQEWQEEITTSTGAGKIVKSEDLRIEKV